MQACLYSGCLHTKLSVSGESLTFLSVHLFSFLLRSSLPSSHPLLLPPLLFFLSFFLAFFLSFPLQPVRRTLTLNPYILQLHACAPIMLSDLHSHKQDRRVQIYEMTLLLYTCIPLARCLTHTQSSGMAWHFSPPANLFLLLFPPHL